MNLVNNFSHLNAVRKVLIFPLLRLSDIVEPVIFGQKALFLFPKGIGLLGKGIGFWGKGTLVSETLLSG